MVALVAWKRQQGGDVPSTWGLKRFASLLCERHIADRQPKTVLEAGVGFDAQVHDLLGPDVDYWTIDKEGFYDHDLFQQGLARRHRATHVDGLLGAFHPELPPSYFDLTFSISTLEHADVTDAPTICKDLYRVTRPGGFTIHTIDTQAHRPELQLYPWHDAFLTAGFDFTEPPDLSYGSHGIDGLAVLVEPLNVQVWYFRTVPDFWENPPPIRYHSVSIIVIARRP